MRILLLWVASAEEARQLAIEDVGRGTSGAFDRSTIIPKDYRTLVEEKRPRVWPFCLSFCFALAILPRMIGAADCNGNGVDDELDVANETSVDCNENSVPDECEQDVFSLGLVGAPLESPFALVRIVAADLDDEGDLDVIGLGAGGEEGLVVFRNSSKQPAGGFAQPEPYSVVSRAEDLATGDLDGDGDVDIAVLSREDVSLHWNDGTGVLSEPTVVPLPEESQGEVLTAGDLNGDGALDLVVVLKTNDAVATLINDGKGIFSHSATVSVGDGPREIFAGDVDRDGDTDVVTANLTAKSLSILRNDGTGALAAETVLPLEARPRDLQAADVDGDGSLDFVVPLNTGHTVILLNSGDGMTFQATSFGSATSRARLADVDADGDFDGDGDTDLVLAVFRQPVGLFLWSGEESSFAVTSTTQALRNSRPPHTATMADFDGDGIRGVTAPDRRSTTGRAPFSRGC